MLNIDDSVLVIIDIQDKLVKAASEGDKCALNAIKMAKASKNLNIPVFVTEQYPTGLGYTVKELFDNLHEKTEIFEKTSFSALLNNDFKDSLFDLPQKQIILCGIELHICVLQTAFDLITEGYEVYILKDACSSRHSFEFETGIELLRQYGAKITCLEIALFELLKTSKHPAFKDIQALIK